MIMLFTLKQSLTSFGDTSLSSVKEDLLSLYINPFSINFPLIDKPGSWFLLAKCWKNTCGRVTF